MKRRNAAFLAAAAVCLILTGCGYRKPEVHSMMGLNINSITTVCGTECTMDDIDVTTVGEHVSTTYAYTDVDGERGAADAKKYHQYLSSLPSCIRIDTFSSDSGEGNYNAYFKVTDKIDEGFRMKVTFTRDTYTVQIEDNVDLEEV